MPGSIQVSVSLGKVEHEAEEDRSFSFPLTNLRDNLIITVEDSEGNQVSQSGVRTMLIIEKGTWDDVFPMEGGGLIHMKLQFFLSDEERDRIRLMRESAMKKKQAGILGSRHEASGVLSASSSQNFQRSCLNIDISSNASESCVGIKEESFKRQSSTEVENALEKIPDDVKETNKESTSNDNDNNNNNNAVKSEPLYNMVENLDTQILEDKDPSFVQKTSKESKFPPWSKETEVNTIENNGIRLQETSILKSLQDSSSRDVGPSRLSLQKIPQTIKKMISVFESSTSQDGASLKPVSTKSYRFGTSRLSKDDTVRDYYEKSTSLKHSESSSSSRLRTSFSTGDLRESLSNITTKGDQVDFDNSFVEPSQNMQSPHEGVNNENKSINGRKTSKVNLEYFDQDGSGQWTRLDEKRQLCMTEQGDKAVSLLSDHKIEEKGHQENIVPIIPEVVVKDEEIKSPESADAEASNGTFGQAMKIALVVGFGVLVFLFRPRDSGKGTKENKHALRNQVFMNKRGSTEEQDNTTVSRLP